MAYTAPTTLSTSDLVTATIYNRDIVDNVKALKDPPSSNYDTNEAGNYTTTSATFVDIDSSNLALTITTTGGDVMMGFVGAVSVSVAARVHLDVDLDGSQVAGDDGITGLSVGTGVIGWEPSFVYLVTSLSAGSHTFTIQWKTSAGTATLYAGAGTANADVHPQFWVREVS